MDDLPKEQPQEEIREEEPKESSCNVRLTALNVIMVITYALVLFFFHRITNSDLFAFYVFFLVFVSVFTPITISVQIMDYTNEDVGQCFYLFLSLIFLIVTLAVIYQ